MERDKEKWGGGGGGARREESGGRICYRQKHAESQTDTEMQTEIRDTVTSLWTQPGSDCAPVNATASAHLYAELFSW